MTEDDFAALRATMVRAVKQTFRNILLYHAIVSEQNVWQCVPGCYLARLYETADADFSLDGSNYIEAAFVTAGAQLGLARAHAHVFLAALENEKSHINFAFLTLGRAIVEASSRSWYLVTEPSVPVIAVDEAVRMAHVSYLAPDNKTEHRRNSLRVARYLNDEIKSAENAHKIVHAHANAEGKPLNDTEAAESTARSSEPKRIGSRLGLETTTNKRWVLEQRPYDWEVVAKLDGAMGLRRGERDYRLMCQAPHGDTAVFEYFYGSSVPMTENTSIVDADEIRLFNVSSHAAGHAYFEALIQFRAWHGIDHPQLHRLAAQVDNSLRVIDEASVEWELARDDT